MIPQIKPSSLTFRKLIPPILIKSESYFATCERDEGGQCLPSGEGGKTEKPEKPETERVEAPKGDDVEYAEWEQRQVSRDARRDVIESIDTDDADDFAKIKAAHEGWDNAQTNLIQGDVTDLQVSVNEVVSVQSNIWDKHVAAFKKAGAANKELTGLQKTTDRAKADLVKKADVFMAHVGKMQVANADFQEQQAAEPEYVEPAEPDYPEEPEEPEEPDEADYPDYAEYQQAQKDYESSYQDYDKAHDQWEKESAELESAYEKAKDAEVDFDKEHERWEEQISKAEERVTKESDKLDDLRAELRDAAEEWDNKIVDDVSDTSETINARLDKEEESDSEPEEEEEKPKSEGELVNEVHGKVEKLAEQRGISYEAIREEAQRDFDANMRDRQEHPEQYAAAKLDDIWYNVYREVLQRTNKSMPQIKPSLLTLRKLMPPLVKSTDKPHEGEPCKQGWTEARTGCVPAGGAAEGQPAASEGGTSDPGAIGEQPTDDMTISEHLEYLGFNYKESARLERDIRNGGAVIKKLSKTPLMVRTIDLTAIVGTDSDLENEANPIEDYRDVDPVIVGYDGELIDGNHRVAGIAAGGGTKVRVIVASKEDLKAANEFGGLLGRGSESEENWIRWMQARSNMTMPVSETEETTERSPELVGQDKPDPANPELKKELKSLSIPQLPLFSPHLIKAKRPHEGEPCKRGWTRKRTGCVPASGAAEGQPAASEGGTSGLGATEGMPSAEAAEKPVVQDKPLVEMTREDKKADWKANGVKSRAFVAWFGDWQNDPANASKVVNRDGEPLEVFHGTNDLFDAFEKSTNVHTRTLGINTYFFTNNKAVASTYTVEGKGKMIAGYLNLRNPLVIDADGREWIDALDDIQDQLTTYVGPKDKAFQEGRDEIFSKYDYDSLEVDWDGTVSDKDKNNLKKLAGEADEERSGIMKNLKLGSSDKLPIWGIRQDGIIIKNVLDMTALPVNEDLYEEGDYSPFGDVYVAFKPTQIKSTDNEGEFDPANPELKKELKSLSIPQLPLFSPHLIKAKRPHEGEPCKRGWTRKRTGCVPASGEGQEGVAEAVSSDPGVTEGGSTSVLQVKQVFGVDKKIEYLTDDSGKVYGEHSPDKAVVVNPKLGRGSPVGINFKTAPGVSETDHIIAHELVHQAYSDDSELGKEMIERLSRVKAQYGSAISIYGAFEGGFENIIELGAVYTHSPNELKVYSEEMYEIAKEWSSRLRGGTGKGEVVEEVEKPAKEPETSVGQDKPDAEQTTNKIEGTDKLIEMARMSPSFQEFKKKVRQAHLTDLSEREARRWGRALPLNKDEPFTDLKEIIANKKAPGSYFETLKYEVPDTYKALIRAIASGKGTIIVYRAVPVKASDEIEIGDYIALDKGYAQNHAEGVLEGEQGIEAKVISTELPLSDVVWGEADWNEWAYSPKKLRDDFGSLEELYERTKENKGLKALSLPETAKPPGTAQPMQRSVGPDTLAELKKELKSLSIPQLPLFSPHLIKADRPHEGEPCKRGWTRKRTGCVPAGGAAEGQPAASEAVSSDPGVTEGTLGETEAAREAVDKPVNRSGLFASKIKLDDINDEKVLDRIHSVLTELHSEYGLKLDSVTTEDMEDIDLASAARMSAFTSSMYADGKKVEKTTYHLELNRNTWKDVASLQAYRASIPDGYLADPSSVGMLRHEMAHALDKAHPEYRDIINSIFKEYTFPTVSAYSSTDPKEMLAEAFSHYKRQGSLENTGLEKLIQVFEGWKRQGAKAVKSIGHVKGIRESDDSWKMTSDEYVAAIERERSGIRFGPTAKPYEYEQLSPQSIEGLKREHRHNVRTAMANASVMGYVIPQKVIAEYPEFASKYEIKDLKPLFLTDVARFIVNGPNLLIDESLWQECQNIVPLTKPAFLPMQLGIIDNGIKVMIVDGNKVKTAHDMDFVDADNGEHSEYIPKDEIWIDAGVDISEWPYDLYHEAHERRLMGEGDDRLGYDEAHALANEAEKMLRQRLPSADIIRQKAMPSADVIRPQVKQNVFGLEQSTKPKPPSISPLAPVSEPIPYTKELEPHKVSSSEEGEQMFPILPSADSIRPVNGEEYAAKMEAEYHIKAQKDRQLPGDKQNENLLGVNMVKVPITESLLTRTKDGRKYLPGLAEKETQATTPKEPTRWHEDVKTQGIRENVGMDRLGGVIPTNFAAAKSVDLITLPDDVSGVNCGNCSFFKAWEKNGFCGHAEVQMEVSRNQCCARWDAPGTYRAWETNVKNLTNVIPKPVQEES